MSEAPAGRFLMPLSEYNRIYQVAHGTIGDVGDAQRACMFFNAFGAYVLSKHYKIPARVVAGAFGLCVSDRPDVAFFGHHTDNRLSSSSDGFHMWVQTETHIVDFMAPIFPEVFGGLLPDRQLPRKMLQRLIATEAAGASSLVATGDFVTFPDPDLTDQLVDNFFKRPANGDLMMVAEAWFGSRRAKQKRSFSMQNDLGEVYELALPATVATGAW